MKKPLLLFILLLGLTSQIYTQVFKNSIVEVYVDNDTLETFEYSLQIISNKDTIGAEIINNYFIPTLNLNSQVTLLFFYKNKKVSVSNVEDMFLLGMSYIKVKISSTAEDTCVETREECLDMIDIYKTKCQDFHSVLLKRLSVYDYRDFYKEWKRTKTLKSRSNIIISTTGNTG